MTTRTRTREAVTRERTSELSLSGELAEPRISGEVEELTAAGLASPIIDAFQRATTRVRDRWDPGDDGSSAEETRARVAWLCRAIRTSLLGEEPKLDGIAAPMPGRKMLEQLRGEFLAEVGSPSARPEGQQLVQVLAAMERVQSALDRDSAQRFANRLSGADGLELVVEVAHDMRSPLASVLFLAETLRNGRSGGINPIQERQIGLVYSAAFGLSSLASDVIELVRGGDRLIDQNPIAFSISDTLQAVSDIVQPIAEEKGLAVRLIPPESDLRMGHPAALNRVLLNLTTNGLKFTSEGYVDVSCRHLSRTRVEFSVRDTGRGIPQEVMGTLFDAFRRKVKPGAFTFSSAGLGLSICRKLVSGMGGDLKVETAAGSGTRFYFELDLPLAVQM